MDLVFNKVVSLPVLYLRRVGGFSYQPDITGRHQNHSIGGKRQRSGRWNSIGQSVASIRGTAQADGADST